MALHSWGSMVSRVFFATSHFQSWAPICVLPLVCAKHFDQAVHICMWQRHKSCIVSSQAGGKGPLRSALGVPATPQGHTSSPAAGGPTARLSGGGGGAAASSGPPPDADAIVMRAADLLLVLAHADTATKVPRLSCSRHGLPE